jgi:membrane protein
LLSGLTFKNLWHRIVSVGQLLRLSVQEFNVDSGLKFSASLSYYTLFSMAPMLIIVIAIGSIVLGKEAAEGYLYLQFEGLIGKLGALQLQEMIKNVRISGDTPWVTVVGVSTFFLGATGVFIEIQDSINSIWSIKAKPKRGWVRFVLTRMVSFSMVVGIGFLLMVSLVLSAALSMLDGWLTSKYAAQNIDQKHDQSNYSKSTKAHSGFKNTRDGLAGTEQKRHKKQGECGDKIRFLHGINLI